MKFYQSNAEVAGPERHLLNLLLHHCRRHIKLNSPNHPANQEEVVLILVMISHLWQDQSQRKENERVTNPSFHTSYNKGTKWLSFGGNRNNEFTRSYHRCYLKDKHLRHEQSLYILAQIWSPFKIQIALETPLGMTNTARVILQLAFELHLASRWKIDTHQFCILLEDSCARNSLHLPAR